MSTIQRAIRFLQLECLTSNTHPDVTISRLFLHGKFGKGILVDNSYTKQYGHHEEADDGQHGSGSYSALEKDSRGQGAAS